MLLLTMVFYEVIMIALKEVKEKGKTWTGLALSTGLSSSVMKRLRIMVLGTCFGECTDADYDKLQDYIIAKQKAFNDSLAGYITLLDWTKKVRRQYGKVNSLYHAFHGLSLIKRVYNPFDNMSHKLYIKETASYQDFLDDFTPGSTSERNKKTAAKQKEKDYSVSEDLFGDEMSSMLFWISMQRPSIVVDRKAKTVDGMSVSWKGERLVLSDGTDLNYYINYIKRG
jgi:hypothetical protein